MRLDVGAQIVSLGHAFTFLVSLLGLLHFRTNYSSMMITATLPLIIFSFCSLYLIIAKIKVLELALIGTVLILFTLL